MFTHQAEEVDVKLLGLAERAVLQLIVLVGSTDHTPPLVSPFRSSLVVSRFSFAGHFQ